MDRIGPTIGLVLPLVISPRDLVGRPDVATDRRCEKLRLAVVRRLTVAGGTPSFSVASITLIRPRHSVPG